MANFGLLPIDTQTGRRREAEYLGCDAHPHRPRCNPASIDMKDSGRATRRVGSRLAPGYCPPSNLDGCVEYGEG